MSEYQYYEFVAIDRALSAKQQDELRAVSTRGRISSTSFVNDYQWGDLKADPRVWMERHFDAHLYLANWGTHRIALRLPRAALELATAGRYCVGDSAVCRRGWATCPVRSRHWPIFSDWIRICWPPRLRRANR